MKTLNSLFKDYCHEIVVLIPEFTDFHELRKKLVIGGGISRQNSLIAGIVNAYEELFNEKSDLGFDPISTQACHFHNDSNPPRRSVLFYV